MRVMGLMSGTSADGVDAALVELYGAPPNLEWQILGHTAIAFPAPLRERILTSSNPNTSSVDKLCALNFALGEFYAEVVIRAAADAGFALNQIDLIGSHGQTVWHAPAGPEASTLQIGEAAVIAEKTGIPVISNFRPRDIAAGGQGAPLVSYVDSLIFRHDTQYRALQNIGGIGNVTFLPPRCMPNEPVIAFDTGPGNMLIDDAAARISAGHLTFDVDGKIAAAGKVHHGLLDELLGDPYFQKPPPKTTGREYFGKEFADHFWETAQSLKMSDEDSLATLTQLTASSIAWAYQTHLPGLPDEIILSGGGARNKTLLRMLSGQLPSSTIILIDDLGVTSEQKEAFAFAILAYETWHRRPGNLPEATGADHPAILGNITPAKPRESLAAHATEAPNTKTANIDKVTTKEMVELMNREDQLVAAAVETQLPQIAVAIDAIAARMKRGGRLIYIGAGTSGRMGVLDAAECPPTFNSPPDLVYPLIAGGAKAIIESVEGAEDNEAAGKRDLLELKPTAWDSILGIAASGRTPYVLSGMRTAKAAGALVISLACNDPSQMGEEADIAIAPVVGPEVITGSTRLKAGTAQKMVLNMISTGVMIKLGKTFGNLMVDVQKTNDKLRSRAVNIVRLASGVDEDTARSLLQQADGEVKTAIVAQISGINAEEARSRLRGNNGIVREALEGNHG